MSAPVEAVLAEIGKAFRLCRFYPATHPSVQQALSSVSSVLPDLVKVGPIELKITTTGFSLGHVAIAPRNPPVAELASLLYTQGHRFLFLEPGLTVEEIAALIRAATSSTERAMQALGGQAAFEGLPHIRLERAPLRGAAPRRRAAAPGSDAPLMGRGSMAAFRPDALPPDIEVQRLAVLLTDAAGEEGERVAARIGALLPDLAAHHDFKTIAAAACELGRASASGDALTSSAASLALEHGISTAAIAGLVARLGDAKLSAPDRDESAQAVAALGPRAVGPVADAYLHAEAGIERDVLLAVIRRVGPLAAEPLLTRANPDARGEAACAQARLLGATRSPDAALVLGAFAGHAEAAVREIAIDGLARIDTPEASRVTLGALRDPDARVRCAAARGIGWFGDPSAASLILVRLEVEDDEGAAICMIDALGELREAGAVPMLAGLAQGVSGVFQRHSTVVRVAAARALGQIGTDAARESLRERLSSSNHDVRHAAAQALGG